MTITGNFECFQYFDFETNFLENKNLFFKKLENSFVVESTTIESVTYPYKTALSEANVKTNRMGSTKWTYLKECSFARTYFFFFKFHFSIRTCYKELIWSIPTTQMPIFILSECSRVFFEGAFSLWVSLKLILLHH